jgi:hypothetical protein
MKKVCIFIAMVLMACTAGPSENPGSPHSDKNQPSAPKVTGPATENELPKMPPGYIDPKIYLPGRFGGFIGDCASDENFQWFWECMSENAGNSFN